MRRHADTNYVDLRSHSIPTGSKHLKSRQWSGYPNSPSFVTYCITVVQAPTAKKLVLDLDSHAMHCMFSANYANGYEYQETSSTKCSYTNVATQSQRCKQQLA